MQRYPARFYELQDAFGTLFFLLILSFFAISLFTLLLVSLLELAGWEPEGEAFGAVIFILWMVLYAVAAKNYRFFARWFASDL